MINLTYSRDEVKEFHPAFLDVGNECLSNLGMSADFEWLHHPASAGIGVIPDFVLAHRATGRWIVIVEIKRRPDVVNSERSQIQAKGYAEANTLRFRNGFPCYFAITNLEVTHLFSLRGALPPRDCRVEDMSFASGLFSATPPAQHRAALITALSQMIEFCRDNSHPTFSVVWPQIARNLFQHAENLPFFDAMDTSAGALSEVVRDYFSIDYRLSSRREMLVRCLLIEYLRGILRRYEHPRSNTIAAVGTSLAGAANAMTQIRTIDFAGVFEEVAGSVYLGFEKCPDVRIPFEAYLAALSAENISTLAATRIDSPTLALMLIAESAAPGVRDARGKAATDPELASLLTALAVTDPNAVVMDPGCGEGNLLSAAYDRLRELGATHSASLSQIHGIEADSLAARITALRLALKEPRLAQDSDPCHVGVGDMFGLPNRLFQADIILMNPPFKRYEAQDDAPLPPEMRAYFRDAIHNIDGVVSTDFGQSNLYALYIEFSIRAAKNGAILGFILDNKWFHNDASKYIRSFILTECAVIGVITYPHERFFEGLMIATSMLILRKGNETDNHHVSFARVEDPSEVSASEAASAIRGGPTPHGWALRRVAQSQLTDASWKTFLTADLVHEFRVPPLVYLNDIYTRARRGSLAKEGGGIAVFEFPQGRSQYGPTRKKKLGGNRFQTQDGPALTVHQNQSLRQLAAAIPDIYLGYAINRADRINGYELSINDVTQDQTIELPAQRQAPLSSRYRASSRATWSAELDQAVDSIPTLPGLNDYVLSIENEVCLDEQVLPRDQLWNVLREPYAGELIISRKMREGHRVHINNFAFEESGRQLRLSSNFLTYGGCTAVDATTNLDSAMANKLVAAWLISSFGHLQFELEGNNREGLRSLEQAHANRIWILDPRHISVPLRNSILAAFALLPYPIRTDLRPELQSELVVLDKAFAAALGAIIPDFDADSALRETWNRLHEMHEARRQ